MRPRPVAVARPGGSARRRRGPRGGPRAAAGTFGARRRRHDRAGRIAVAPRRSHGRRAGARRRRSGRLDRRRRHRALGEARQGHDRRRASGPPRRTQDLRDRAGALRRAAPEGRARAGRPVGRGSRALRTRACASRAGDRDVQRAGARDAAHAPAGAGNAVELVRAAPRVQRPGAQPAQRHGHRRAGGHAGRRRRGGPRDRHGRLLLQRQHRVARPRRRAHHDVRAPRIDRREGRRRGRRRRHDRRRRRDRPRHRSAPPLVGEPEPRDGRPGALPARSGRHRRRRADSPRRVTRPAKRRRARRCALRDRTRPAVPRRSRASPDDVERGTRRAGGDRHRQAAVQRHPRSNPISFIAICPWSWYIDTTAS